MDEIVIADSLYNILSGIIGIPQNDTQATFLYLAACCIGVLIVYFLMYIIKVISSLVRTI